MNQENLGVSSKLFVSGSAVTNSVIVGGTLDHETEHDVEKWTRVLTRRAAKILWYQLTLVLFPERAPEVTALATTAPLSGGAPELTTHVAVEVNDDNFCDIVGSTQSLQWRVRLHSNEIRRLWAELDMMLFPEGWEEARKEPGPPRRRQTYQ